METEIKSEDLVIGKKYNVFSEDCCLSINICGIFLGWELDEDGQEDYESPIFDFGDIWGYRLSYYECE